MLEATQRLLSATSRTVATSSEGSSHEEGEPRLTEGGTTVTPTAPVGCESYGMGSVTQATVKAYGTVTVSTKTARFLRGNKAVRTTNISKTKGNKSNL